MTKEITTSEILLIIDARDKHTQDKLIDIMETQKKTAETLEKVANHIIISEEDKKHDAEFKKEVRGHIKDASPLLSYVREQKATVSKVKTAFFVAIMFAVLAALGFSLK